MSIRIFFLWLTALFFVLAGLNHFRDPAPYLSMMPPWVPWPEIMNGVAGAAEVLGGIGLLVERVRRPAAWGLLVLLVAVFPANWQVARHGWPGMPIAPWILWVRLPLQLVMMAVVWWVGLSSRPHAGRKKKRQWYAA